MSKVDANLSHSFRNTMRFENGAQRGTENRSKQFALRTSRDSKSISFLIPTAASISSSHDARCAFRLDHGMHRDGQSLQYRSKMMRMRNTNALLGNKMRAVLILDVNKIIELAHLFFARADSS
ncbi:MAG: hypothetical protein JNM89_15395 [Hyphomicrobiaceae bacterium]|nr:hypothetical protein [Hyphomicrobiaceae bacterium]